MPWRMLRVLLVVMIVVGVSSGVVSSQSEVLQIGAPLGDAITYQGWLQQNGVAVDGVCDLRFALFDAAGNGAQVGSTLDRPNHAVAGGYFTVSDLDFGAVFTGQARWLEVAVRCPAGSGDFTTLAPRSALAPAPYALYAANNWALLGNTGTTAATSFVGTTDAVTLTLKVSNTVALRLLPNAVSPSLVGGIGDNSVGAGVLGATIAGGGGPASGVVQPNRVTDDYGVIGGGVGNLAGDNAGTTADRGFATIGGGRGNAATGLLATIGGGQAHAATNTYATVGGGVENNATGRAATVAGGETNQAGADNATVGGGIENVASGLKATIAGGVSNEASGDNAAIGGGLNNEASGGGAFVGGGGSNHAAAVSAFVGGGDGNQATGQHSTIGGGFGNQATDLYATLGGGIQNVAGAEYATLGGGYLNQSIGSWSTVGGGTNNLADDVYATIAGGNTNHARGYGAAVGGGSFNWANGDYAAVSGGVDAYASHFGEWAHASGGFSDNQTGEAQTSLYVLRGTTNGNVSADLTLGPSQRLTIAQGRTVVFEIQIAARSLATLPNFGQESAGYTALGVIENYQNVTSILAPGAAVTVLGEDDTNWGVAVAADDTNDSLKITVTGNTNDVIRWVATVRTTEVQN